VSLRSVVFGLVGVMLAYLCWLLLRLIFTRRKKSPAFSEMPVLGAGATSGNDTIQSRIIGGGVGRSSSSDIFHGHEVAHAEVLPEVKLDASERRFPPPPEPDAAHFGFDALLEMRQTRHLVDDLQRSLRETVDELAVLRREIAEVRAAAQVSPFYSEAVGLARRGYDAQAIAERCGISVAEAEMVRSLSGEPQQAED
jgi:hypothetical protein